MILFSSVVLSLLLALRQVALVLIRKEFSWKDYLLFVTYITLSAFLFFSSDTPFALKEHLWLLGLFVSLFALELFFHKKTSFLYRFCFFSLFAFVCVLQGAVTSLPHFYEDRPVAKITLTGSMKTELASWKNPSSPLQEASFPSYEVKIETLKGKLLQRCFVYGDLVGIRAKVIRLHPVFTFLGVPNLCKIDSLFNDYFSQEKKRSHPHQVFPFQEKTSLWSVVWQKGLWTLWNKLFFQKATSLFIKSATLEANYFPLVDERGNPLRTSYYLTVTAGGLSSLSPVAE